MPKYLVWFEAVSVEAESTEEARAKARGQLLASLPELDIEDVVCDEEVQEPINEAEIIALAEGKDKDEDQV